MNISANPCSLNFARVLKSECLLLPDHLCLRLKSSKCEFSVHMKVHKSFSASPAAVGGSCAESRPSFTAARLDLGTGTLEEPVSFVYVILGSATAALGLSTDESEP